jgi:hypothetical protein
MLKKQWSRAKDEKTEEGAEEDEGLAVELQSLDDDECCVECSENYFLFTQSRKLILGSG